MTKLNEIRYLLDDFENELIDFLGLDNIEFEDYKNLRNEYLERVPNLFWYTVAGKTFGLEMERRILGLHSDFQKPNKNSDPENYKYYDIILPYKKQIIKIEVKASRGTDLNENYNLIKRALAKDNRASFDMNFQQLKPRFCDVFVFIAVWLDRIDYWVLSSNEVLNNKYYNDKQHKSNVGEGQLHIKNTNILEFDQYLVKPENIKKRVIEKFLRK